MATDIENFIKEQKAKIAYERNDLKASFYFIVMCFICLYCMKHLRFIGSWTIVFFL